MNDLMIFKNDEFGEVRSLKIDGEPYFVGKDVATILGYAKPLNALSTHVDEDDSLKQGLIDNIGRMQETIIINESGLYSLILSSKLPNAKKFKHWVTSEVLPSIRKHGAYMNEQTLEEALVNPDFLIKLATELKIEKENRKKLEEKNKEMKPKALFADAVATSNDSILVGQLAKLIKQNGKDIGQNRLFDWMRKNNYLCSKGSNFNLPTQKSMQLGLMEIKERTVTNPDGSIRVTKTTKITGKGQVYFINKFKGGDEHERHIEHID